MIKKTVEYIDYNGKAKKAELRFHISKLEYIELVASLGDDLDVVVKKLVDNNDVQGMIAMLKRVLLLAYGEIVDGEFDKEDVNGVPFKKKFAKSEQFAELFADLLENPESTQDFFAHVVPNKKNRQTSVPKKVVKRK